MNREIKFRAWDKQENTMSDVAAISWQDGEISVWQNEQEVIGVPLDERIVLMQSTGLHDKNGKEIWEGDVVRWHYMTETRAVVQYDTDYASYEPFDRLSFEKVRDTFEVIGNIYEHPDLLKS